MSSTSRTAMRRPRLIATSFVTSFRFWVIETSKPESTEPEFVTGWDAAGPVGGGLSAADGLIGEAVSAGLMRS